MKEGRKEEREERNVGGNEEIIIPFLDCFLHALMSIAGSVQYFIIEEAERAREGEGREMRKVVKEKMHHFVYYFIHALMNNDEHVQYFIIKEGERRERRKKGNKCGR